MDNTSDSFISYLFIYILMLKLNNLKNHVLWNDNVPIIDIFLLISSVWY